MDLAALAFDTHPEPHQVGACNGMGSTLVGLGWSAGGRLQPLQASGVLMRGGLEWSVGLVQGVGYSLSRLQVFSLQWVWPWSGLGSCGVMVVAGDSL